MDNIDRLAKIEENVERGFTISLAERDWLIEQINSLRTSMRLIKIILGQEIIEYE